MCVTTDVCYFDIKMYLLFLRSNFVYTPNPLGIYLFIKYLFWLIQILNDIQFNINEASVNNCSCP